MALDLSKIVNQVTGMVAGSQFHRDERDKQLQHTLGILHSQSNNTEQLQKKIEASKLTWLVAHLTEPVDRRYQPQAAPVEFTIIGTDGSHIDVDRHQPTHCYLINIGSVVLKYGPQPDAILDSVPHLYASPEELVIAPPGIQGRDQSIEGDLLGIKRGVEECKQLAELAADIPSGGKGLGLIDGSLIMWNLEGYPDFVGDVLLEKGFLTYLEQIRKLQQPLGRGHHQPGSFNDFH